MSFSPIQVPDWLAQPAQFDTVIDVRSPAEFAEDHLPGAVNWPVLDDAERAHVGTVYTQVSTFEARKQGAALVSRRIADTLERHVADKPKDWRPLVYCWRGGQRSGSLSLVLAQIGFRTRQLQGGYKAFRAQVRDDLATLPGRFQWQVLRGRTGSGKTRLLAALAQEGAQVLDLEALAAHRGSVLGGLPGVAQPGQKQFEGQIWQRLQGFDPLRPVFVEAESRRIGARQLPDGVLAALQAPAGWVELQMDIPARTELLLDEYRFFTAEPEALCERLAELNSLRGNATVARWQSLARAGDWSQLLPELLDQHYDPLYDRQQRRSSAPVREMLLASGQPDALQAAARSLLA
ncbi:MAG TPA: tRNA 2-selenouridine(34) synthase MnmH [Ideonella sp.]|uniref:tRNA 2-selenouridine(34) synthase MnmH n=1 Tax=Ideonella sp. TaxID=1929293 RepID=UPI002D015792|nr:tRNA 2-selenouridine(34) synthase MnmH [Ideonella sp.]HSI51588.1 tRNA 2-selenouridine(34) synthase MnmH [Ideonella sp.]